jgi:hypothetical protein
MLMAHDLWRPALFDTGLRPRAFSSEVDSGSRKENASK